MRADSSEILLLPTFRLRESEMKRADLVLSNVSVRVEQRIHSLKWALPVSNLCHGIFGRDGTRALNWSWAHFDSSGLAICSYVPCFAQGSIAARPAPTKKAADRVAAAAKRAPIVLRIR